MIIVIAESWSRFTSWCSMDCDPPENPKDRKFVVFLAPWGPRGGGRNQQEGDRVILIGHPRWNMQSVVLSLLPCGFRKYETEDGVEHDLTNLLPAKP